MEYTKRILIATDNYEITLYATYSSKKCIITFGEIDSKLEESGFGSKLILMDGYDHIYVAQKINTQYQFLKAEEFKEIIQNEIIDKEVFTYGSSLGAYCAIYYGGIINANILALSPRIPAHPIINDLIRGVFKNKGFFHKELINTVKTHNRVAIFYDKDNYIDNYYINIFVKPAYPNASYYYISHAGHYTARALLLSDELKNIARSFFENRELIFTLNEEEIINWHLKRVKKRLEQNKLFHARENLDVLLRSSKAFDSEVIELVNEYRTKLLTTQNNSRKEIVTMKTTKSISQNNQEIFNKFNIDISKKAFKRYYSTDLLINIDKNYLSQTNNYWKKYYGKEIDPVLNLAFLNLTKKPDPRVIPSNVMWNELIPFFNDMNIKLGYSDKNMYDKMIHTSNTPKTILKRVRGHYFNSDNKELTSKQALEVLINYKDNLIIKPSDTDNGKGVNKIYYKNNQIYLDDEIVEIEKLESLYGYNFTIQEVIEQHSIMAKPHPFSVNTLRMVTLRWNNEIKYLLTFARFGANNSVKDNAGMGGLCVGIKDDGELLDIAIDEDAKVYTHHPTTNYNFKDYAKVPNFDKFKNFVIELHQDILHHDFVSWDIAVGVDEEPIFIEANYRGATWIYQLAAQRPLFGDLTEEILEYVRKEKDLNKDVGSNLIKTKMNKKKLQQQIDKLIKEKENLQLQLNEEKRQVEIFTKENQSIKNSKSWKVTSPLRKIANKIK